jgi:hypothetical protein
MLFEAVVLALARFLRTGLSESAFGPATRLRIAARPAGRGPCRHGRPRQMSHGSSVFGNLARVTKSCA